MTNTKIDNIVKGLTEWYETTDIDNLLSALKIQVKYYNKKELDVNEDAFAHGKTIELADDVSGDYLEFLKYHELGHILLHADIFATPIAFSGLHSKYEREANTFAVKMLMIKYDATEQNIKNVLYTRYKISI